MSDFTLGSSESNDHDRCDGESSSSDDVFHADTVQQNAAQWSFIGDSSNAFSASESDSGSWQFDTMAGAWAFVPLTQQTAQIALDAVRYQNNYARTVTTRFCLHYINTIRVRKISGLTSYIISVDGCESKQIAVTGRCDIYYCRPYTYELQLTQKTIGGTVFTVQSIYKTVDQKTLIELRQDSNLDFSTAPDVNLGTGADSIIKQAGISQQPAMWQDGDDGSLQGSSVVDDEEPIAWTSDVNNGWESQSTLTVQIKTESLSLRAEPISTSASELENSAGVVAIVGIAAVVVATIAFIVAFVLVRWCGQRNTSQCEVNREYSPLRSTLNTENTISMTSRDTIGRAGTKPDLEKVEFFC